jgi:ZipA, C-terminal FtsZ-binding domain
MSSLVTSLLILAGVALLAVVVYNWRQGAKGGVSGRSKLGAGHGSARRPDVDPLLEPAKLDHGMPLDGAQHFSAQSGKAEPALNAISEHSPGLATAKAAPTTALMAKAAVSIDERVDAIVHISLNEPVPGDRLIALTSGLRRAGTKPVTVEAAGPQGWQALVSNASFDALRVGVLMSNRQGPLNGVEFSEFVNALQPLGEHLEVMIDPPNLTDIVNKARELDGHCAELDAQVALNVDSSQAISPTLLASFANEHHLVEKGNTRYCAVAPSGELLYMVLLSNQANRVNFLLDVPRVPERYMPWAAMVDAASAFAEYAGGQIVDDEGRVLSNDNLRQIGEQLGLRYQDLAHEGFEAGSPLAARVFS